MQSNQTTACLNAFRRLRISPSLAPLASSTFYPGFAISFPRNGQNFSTTPSARAGNWLEPNIDRKRKMAKGRPRVPTGGSTKGTTVIWGDYGIRMIDHHRRIGAKSLKMAEETIKARLRGEKYRLFKRKCCNVGVYVSGNEVSRS